MSRFVGFGLCRLLSGDAAKAAAFWAGLEALRAHFCEGCGPAQFVCDGIASRLANGQSELLVGVVRRLGGVVRRLGGVERAKTVLKAGPLLTALSEFVAYLDAADGAALDTDLATGRARKALTERMEARKRRRLG